MTNKQRNGTQNPQVKCRDLDNRGKLARRILKNIQLAQHTKKQAAHMENIGWLEEKISVFLTAVNCCFMNS